VHGDDLGVLRAEFSLDDPPVQVNGAQQLRGQVPDQPRGGQDEPLLVHSRAEVAVTGVDITPAVNRSWLAATTPREVPVIVTVLPSPSTCLPGTLCSPGTQIPVGVDSQL
jgi:hypothetical protein